MKTIVLDIGGTAIKSGLFCDMQLLCSRTSAAPANKNSSSILNAIKFIIDDYRTEYGLPDQIGISTTGQVDTNEGSIIYSNGIMEPYTGTALKKELEERYHIPVKVENDANCAALGEAYFGSGKEFTDFLCLTFGTGIGGGIILDRKLYGGTAFSAGEFGALLTHCDQTILGDPWSGSYENHASTTALVSLAQKRFPDIRNGREIFEHKEDPGMLSVIKEWVWEVSLGLISLIHIFNPEGIVLGGGVMEQSMILDMIRDNLEQMLMPGFRHVSVKQASLGNLAGLYGAAALFLEG